MVGQLSLSFGTPSPSISAGVDGPCVSSGIAVGASGAGPDGRSSVHAESAPKDTAQASRRAKERESERVTVLRMEGAV
jgi:hypothetical protein